MLVVISIFNPIYLKSQTIMEYPIEPGQRMIIKTNRLPLFEKLSHKVICLGKVKSTKNGIIAKKCTYVDENHLSHYIDVPLFLLWRIADDEDLIEMHETYVNSKYLANKNH